MWCATAGRSPGIVTGLSFGEAMGGLRDYGQLKSVIANLAKPAGAKGNYIKHITMAATMGPGIKIDANVAQSLEVSG